jgi:hypothetical protein
VQNFILHYPWVFIGLMIVLIAALGYFVTHPDGRKKP